MSDAQTTAQRLERQRSMAEGVQSPMNIADQKRDQPKRNDAYIQKQQPPGPVTAAEVVSAPTGLKVSGHVGTSTPR